MARIRTIKPEFFTSDDIVELSFAQRLLYIALWCEADREGRFVWQPRAIKRRYFPDDDIDVATAMDALATRGLLVTYASNGDDFGVIPAFKAHQHLNPRESASVLPEPPKNSFKKSTRAPRVDDASTTREPRDSDAQGGRECIGREGKDNKQEEITSSPASHGLNGKPRKTRDQIRAEWAMVKGIPLEEVPAEIGGEAA